MPTYVYECSSCNDQFEVEQRITENALDTCKCGSKGTVKRVIQPVGVMFKGSGFHINDYGAKPSESKSEAAPEPKSESATDASPKPDSTASTPAAPAKEGSA
jgi:putative FmdB family regulatory protein